MKKNVASQVIGAQMITAADGTAFTGTVSCLVTVDAGTQAAGGGAVTHEGNGFHTYAPTQAETNGDHIAFTFTGSGAIPTTVQVYTTFPQTGDNFARLGAPAGASISADVAAVKTQTAAIEVDTADIQGRLPAALVSGRIDASVGAMAADVLTSTALAASAVTEIQSGLSTLDAAGVRTATGLASANLDTQFGAIAGYLDTEVAAILAAVDTEVAAIKAKTDNLPAAPAATGDIPSAATIADAVWDEAIAGHLTAGSTGNALNAAGSAGDPWSTGLPGAYGAGSAGYILGTNLNATISSRASQTSLDTLDDYVDAEVAAILSAVDTEVAAIKAKTDNLPAAPAATGDIPTALQNADALLNRDLSAVSVTNSRSPINALRFIRNKWGISGTTLTVYAEDDVTSAWTATVTATAGADPITGNDPA